MKRQRHKAKLNHKKPDYGPSKKRVPNKVYDIIFVGGGPATIAGAIAAKKKGLNILILEMGTSIGDRRCPAKVLNIPCRGCKVCSIMSGFGGAGAFSDGKYTYSQPLGPYFIGGNLPDYIGFTLTSELIKYIFQDNIDRGAPNNLIKNANKDYLEQLMRSLEEVGLFLSYADVNHIGTTAVQQLYTTYQHDLSDDILFNTHVKDIILSGDRVDGVVTDSGDKYYAKYVVIATGRSGARWFEEISAAHNFPQKASKADFGLRLEVPTRIMKELNENLYEAKIILKYMDRMVRMFCTNPDGAVVTEQTDGITYVNGHSDNIALSDKTNFAILVTTPDLSQEEVRNLGKVFNSLGNPPVQRYVDFVKGEKSSPISIINLHPTLATATAANMRPFFPKKEFEAFQKYMTALNTVVPGITGPETLCYGLEAKFTNSGPKLTNDLRVEGYKNLFVAGDAGVSHGLASAGASCLYAVLVILQLLGVLKGEISPDTLKNF